MVTLNISLIAFVIFGRQGRPNHLGPDQHKHVIIDKLGLDEKQVLDYQVLIEEHQNGIAKSDKEIMNAKKMLFELLTRNDVETEQKLISKINSEQRKIESIHLDHFKALKALCNEDQQSSFEGLTKDLARMFGGSRPMRPGPH